jgi:hypothetical protein
MTGEALDSRVLTVGIRRHIGEIGIPSFPDYGSEIKEFLDAARNSKKELPFVNQDQIFLKAIRSLSTGYPYMVLIGESGIGKSMILNYIIDVLTGKVKLSDLESISPDAAVLMKDVIEKAKQFQNRAYMLLPNLADPLNVKTLSYSDSDKGEQDFHVADSFCQEVSEFLGNYAAERRDNIRITLSEQQFRRYVHSRAHELYVELYSELNDKLDELKRSTPGGIALDEVVSLISLTLPKNFEQDKISGKWQFLSKSKKIDSYQPLKEEAGFNKERENLTVEDIENGLANTFIHKHADAVLFKVVSDIGHIDITGKTEEDNIAIFREEFGKYSEQMLSEVRARYDAGKIKNQKSLAEYWKSRMNYYYPPRNISASSLDNIVEGVKEARDRALKNDCSPVLKDWINSVYNYFQKERKVLRSIIDEMLDDIETVERENLPNTERDKGSDQKTKRQDPDKDQAEDLDDIEFILPHGRYKYCIENVMQVKYFGQENSSSVVTWSKISDVSPDTLFGNIDTEEGENPPHMAFKSLGDFFKSGILVFQDSFSDFIEMITSKNEERSSMREQFLEYLQTGVLTIVDSGIKYQLEVPRMILACDNDDPFNTIRGGIFVRDETGLRGRIQSLYVPSITDNNKEVRKGTIRVLYDTIDRINKERGKQISINPEAANMLLQSMVIVDGIASLAYRDFTKDLEDICSYTISKGLKEITPDVMKNKTKEDIAPGFFYSVDSELSYGGYFDLPIKQAGHVNGLSVLGGSRPGSVVKVRSYFLSGLHRLDSINNHFDHFELLDIKSKLTDETTFKGYELAKDYLRMLITKAMEGLNDPNSLLNLDWQLKTNYGENWNEVGGPSASMAITLSMVSALTGAEFYKNRFITGTIDPGTGIIQPESASAGEIGGTYYKGLIPLRLKELSVKHGKDQNEMYFLFPAANLKDLTKDIIFDPFGLEENITCIPIKSFPQAYHLFTCGEKISIDDWKHAEKYGKEKLNEAIASIRTRFSKASK